MWPCIGISNVTLSFTFSSVASSRIRITPCASWSGVSIENVVLCLHQCRSLSVGVVSFASSVWISDVFFAVCNCFAFKGQDTLYTVVGYMRERAPVLNKALLTVSGTASFWHKKRRIRVPLMRLSTHVAKNSDQLANIDNNPQTDSVIPVHYTKDNWTSITR